MQDAKPGSRDADIGWSVRDSMIQTGWRGWPAALTLQLHALLFVLAVAPLVLHKLPPIADHANHLARMQIIASSWADPDLARYYRIEWDIIPNLAMDLIVPPFVQLFGIYTAGQMFTLLTLAMVATGTIALSRAVLGRFSLVPLAGLPFLYNYVLLIGTTNYLLGIGVALWGMAAWISMRDAGALQRLLVAGCFVVALFFCHLFALGVFGLGILAIELETLLSDNETPFGRRLARFIASGVMFVPALILTRASPTTKLAGSTYWELSGKFDGLVFALTAYSGVIALGLVATLMIAAIATYRSGALKIHRLGWFVLTIGALVFVAMPRMLFDSHMADQRLPIALLFMSVAMIDMRFQYNASRFAFVLMAALLVLIRVAEVEWVWVSEAPEIRDVRQSTAKIDRGARVLIISAEKQTSYGVEEFAIEHAAALATIERSALTTRLFTVAGKQVLRMQTAWLNHVDQLDGVAPTAEQLLDYADKGNRPGEYIYWQKWPVRFDYIYMIHADRDSANPDPRRLELLHEGKRFRLYRILRSAARSLAPVDSPAGSRPPGAAGP